MRTVRRAASQSPPPPPPPDPLVVWAVGDMCDDDNDVPGCGQVADLVAADPTKTYFAALGDLQYEKGTLALFNKYYAPQVGAKLDSITSRSPATTSTPRPPTGTTPTSGQRPATRARATTRSPRTAGH